MKSPRLNSGIVCSLWPGMTPENKDATRTILLESQQGRCAICDREELEMRTPLVMDHNHKTGVIRGLLCHRCNLLVGLIEHDRGELARAYAYIRLIRQSAAIKRNALTKTTNRKS
jgi:hypothetical protein